MTASADTLNTQSLDGRNLTPVRIVESARRVLGAIDLDPASDALANQSIQAKRFFTKDDDGLNQAWNARTIWLNPPGRTLSHGKQVTAAQWGQALIQRFCLGHFESAIYLCYRAGSIGSLGQGFLSNSVVCLTASGSDESRVPEGSLNGSGRFSFDLVLDGERVSQPSNTQSSAIFCLSRSSDVRRAFACEFEKYGVVFEPV